MTSEKIKETPIAIEARNGNRAQPGERLPLIRAAFEPIAVDLQVRQAADVAAMAGLPPGASSGV